MKKSPNTTTETAKIYNRKHTQICKYVASGNQFNNKNIIQKLHFGFQFYLKKKQ